MTAMANMGNLVVALPPSDIWLTGILKQQTPTRRVA